MDRKQFISYKMYTKEELCVSCFSIFNQEIGSKIYHLQTETLTSNFLDTALGLCFVCYKQAKKVENFITNVQKHLVLLESIVLIDEETYKKTRNQIKNITVLTHKKLEPINIVEETNSEESYRDVPFEMLMCQTSEVADQDGTKTELTVKQEIDGSDDDKFNLDFSNETKYESDKESSIKEEKLDNDMETIPNIKSKFRNRRRSKKIKAKLKKKSTKKDVTKRLRLRKSGEIEPIYITLKECMERKQARAQDPTFLSAPYKCKDCVKIFRYKSTFENHMRKHKESKGPHECEICKMRYPSSKKQQAHQKYHMVYYKCKECGETRVNPTALMDHWRKSHSAYPQIFRCPQCPKDFMGRLSLDKHIRSHEANARVTCPLCHKTYANVDVLRAHTRIMHCSEGPIKKYRCPECGKYFTSPSHVQKHLSTHTEHREFYCVECDKSFKTDATLKQHLKYATPHVVCTDLKFDCEMCDKKYANNRALDRHKAAAHANIRPYQCDLCKKTYTSKHSLLEHIQIIHEGFKRPLRYQCHMCERMFARAHVLKTHIRTHTGERPYQCAECPARFSQPTVLRTHTRLIHLRLTRDGRCKVGN